MSEAPTPETQNPQGEPDDLGSLDEAAAAFAARNEPQAEATTEAEPDPESAEETQQEAVEADPGEESDAGELVEVEIDGLKLSVPADQADKLQKGYLRQSDYSRRMNEVGEKEKALAQRIEIADKLAQGAEKYAAALAKVNQYDAEIKQFDSVNWNQMEREDPSRASLIAVKLMRLQQARQDAVNEAQGIDREIQESRTNEINAKRAEMDKVLAKNLKGWGDELGTQITKYALETGWTREALSQLTDPQVVIALDKARRFDALQKSTETIRAKAKSAPPVVKPGAQRPAPDKRAESMARLRKSNSLDDAADAFLSRMK
jgi:hypothetical protein